MRPIGSLLCLLALAAGCGGARRASTPSRLPAQLARSWAQQADAVAAAEDAGDSCGASQLVQGLQSDVIARETSVPLRYRGVLLRAVNELANRIVCMPATVTVVTTPAGPPHPHPPPGPGHGGPGHDHHGPGGGG